MDRTKNQYLDLGLDSFSYSDFILLSSILAYAIGEELNDLDLEYIIIFLGMLSSDLALIETKRSVRRKQQDSDATVNVDTSEELVLSELDRKHKIKKKKYIKKRRIKKKQLD